MRENAGFFIQLPRESILLDFPKRREGKTRVNCYESSSTLIRVRNNDVNLLLIALAGDARDLMDDDVDADS